MPSSIRRIDVAGRDVTEYLQTLLRKSGYIFHTSAEKEVVRLIKESVSYVAHVPKKEERDWAGVKPNDSKFAEYVLPDGHKLKVGFLRLSVCVVTNKGFRLAQSGSEPLRFCSTPRLLVLNIPVSTRLSSMRSTEQTWTFENRSTATLCSQVVAHSPRASVTVS